MISSELHWSGVIIASVIGLLIFYAIIIFELYLHYKNAQIQHKRLQKFIKDNKLEKKYQEWRNDNRGLN